MKLEKNLKYLLSIIIRFLIYAALMALLNMIFLYDANHETSTGKFGEYSLTEIVQEIIVFFLALIFFFTGRINRDYFPILQILSLFFLIAFIREFNIILDSLFLMVLPLILLSGWFLYKGRKVLVNSLHKFIKIPGFSYFMAGWLITFIFSRLFGRKVLWTSIMGNDYNRWVKNAAEEGTELLGYTILLIAGIEILLHVLENKNKRPEK